MNGAFQHAPAEPMGEEPQNIWMRQLMRWIRQYLVTDIKGAKRKPMPNGMVVWVIDQPAAGGLGGGGLRFQTPNIEYDPTIAVAANTVVYLSPNHPFVTAGFLDLGGANLPGLTVSRAGWWVAKKAVPAQVTNPMGFPAGVYTNGPQTPLPGATGGSYSTHPYKGDMDGTGVFWGIFGEVPGC